jgi:tRNA pseudouridine38-40 synthase
MRWLKLTIAYDGAGYVGWQRQSNGLAIQEVLEAVWQRVTGEAATITASGRTDSGVHAAAQVCSVVTATSLDVGALRRALNTYVPSDIAVLEVAEAPDGFHAINDATGKLYRYRIQNGSVRDVFRRRDHWWIRRRLDVSVMRRAGQRLVGEHDLASFQSTGSPRVSTTRTIWRLAVRAQRTSRFRYISIDIEANGFLYGMARNIAGTLAVIGKGKHPPEWLDEVLAARDRRAAGPAAPAHGLMLIRVDYGSPSV